MQQPLPLRIWCARSKLPRAPVEAAAASTHPETYVAREHYKNVPDLQ
jgi:hypothetical protein